MKILSKVGICQILCLASGLTAQAIDLTVSSGSMQLPNSGYHLMTIEGQLRVEAWNPDTHFMFQLGELPPFSGHGFSEEVFYSSFNLEWTAGNPSFRLFGGFGLGIWGDAVNQYVSWLPALTIVGGFRSGGEHFGLQLGISTYLGIQGIPDLWNYNVAWPFYVFTGGLYVSL